MRVVWTRCMGNIKRHLRGFTDSIWEILTSQRILLLRNNELRGPNKKCCLNQCLLQKTNLWLVSTNHPWCNSFLWMPKDISDHQMLNVPGEALQNLVDIMLSSELRLKVFIEKFFLFLASFSSEVKLQIFFCFEKWLYSSRGPAEQCSLNDE